MVDALDMGDFIFPAIVNLGYVCEPDYRDFTSLI